MAELMTFASAQDWARSRVNVPTMLPSAALAAAVDFPAAVRMHAFFSARVAQVDLLDALRGELDTYLAGDTDLASARMRLKTLLTREGYRADDVSAESEPPAGVGEADWKADKGLRNLASTRRLNLILRQNAAMAWSVGEWQVTQDPAIAERWPYYVHRTRRDGRVRDSHAALDGLKLRKDDPYWKSNYPPLDFQCRCYVEESDDPAGVGTSNVREAPNGAVVGSVANGATGAGVQVTGSASGYVFRPDQAFSQVDWERVPEGPYRQQIEREMEAMN